MNVELARTNDDDAASSSISICEMMEMGVVLSVAAARAPRRARFPLAPSARRRRTPLSSASTGPGGPGTKGEDMARRSSDFDVDPEAHRAKIR